MTLVRAIVAMLSGALDRAQGPPAPRVAPPWPSRVRVWPAAYDWAREGDL